MIYFRNLKNKKFGNLTVLRKIGVDNSRNIQWECKCKCGNRTIVSSRHLLSGATTGCGYNCSLKSPDLTGKNFGHLQVIQRDGRDSRGAALWKCRCKCGQYRSVRTHQLKSGVLVQS